jgi:hypothetical protein
MICATRAEPLFTVAVLRLTNFPRTVQLSTLPYGRGQMVITTFKLDATTLSNDVIAQALFDGMVNLL